MFRDLESLRDASFPVQGERGRGGGVALDPQLFAPPVNFSAREAAAPVAAGRWLLEMRVLPFTATWRARSTRCAPRSPLRLSASSSTTWRR